MDNNKKDFISLNTGGFVAQHSKDGVSVRVPKKVTGDIKEEQPEIKGLAKASPLFKKIDPDELSDEDKKKALAKNKKILKDSELREENQDK